MLIIVDTTTMHQQMLYFDLLHVDHHDSIQNVHIRCTLTHMHAPIQEGWALCYIQQPHFEQHQLRVSTLPKMWHVHHLYSIP